MSLEPRTVPTAEFLAAFRAAGVLTAADVHTAAVLARLSGEDRPDVLLAVALAVRAPRHGHVCADLSTVARSAVAEADGQDGGPTSVEDLPWPTDPRSWADEVASSSLVTAVPAPLVVDGTRVYLERYRQYETDVVQQFVRRARDRQVVVDVDDDLLVTLLDGDGSEHQRAAVQRAVRSGLSVLVGGPGTGKTRTVAALLATLLADGRPLDIALAAPTGKAAARLAESFRAAARTLPADLGDRLAAAEASTIHRLLGWQSRSTSRFRHDAGNPLPHDVVIIDETSMVSLPLMAKLLDAVRPDAQLVLVGDPGQLASVEAGSVLGDVAGPVLATDGSTNDRPGPLSGVVSSLVYSHRFPPGSPLDRFARAVRQGDADEAIGVLGDERSDQAERGALSWHPVSADSGSGVDLIRSLALPAAESVVTASVAGDEQSALDALGSVRILCAHRRGPFGVDRWNLSMEAWLAEAGHRTAGWYAGRPLLITANDYPNRLFNGDLGVVVRHDGRPQVAFLESPSPRLVAPSRLNDVETVHAMTIHKSQGSEFDHVVVVVPSSDSRLATRELLYTAVTRAQSRVTLVGDEASIRASIERRVVRASGLADRLWPN
jgi:exodeoxyribonuclease V alpha subunit